VFTALIQGVLVVVDDDTSCCICVMFRLSLPLVVMPDTASGRNGLASRPAGFCYYSAVHSLCRRMSQLLLMLLRHPNIIPGRFPSDIQLGPII